MVEQSTRILVVEDDTGIRSALEEALMEQGYHVHGEAEGSRIDEVAGRFHPDLAILDVRLPGAANGYDLGRRLRRNSDMPLLFLTAADGIDDRLAGFDAGADDYMVKPFVMAELLARIRALLRRAGRMSSAAWSVGNLVLDDFSRQVTRAGAKIELTKTEYDLLFTLCRQPGRVFSKIQLLSQVWGFEGHTFNLVEVHLSSLRHKLEAHGPRMIHTVRGAGYVFRP